MEEIKTIENKKLEMRKLGGQDIFLMLKIMSKTKAKNGIKEFLNKRGSFGNGEKTEEEYKKIGIDTMVDIVDTIAYNIEDAKNEINQLLASLCTVQVSYIESLDMLEYGNLLMNFFQKEELKDFFKLIFSSKILGN